MPWFSYLLNLVYAALVVVAAPVLVYRAVVHGKYREGWGEKLLGNVPQRHHTRPAQADALASAADDKSSAWASLPRLWFHAVSVGEVLQLQTVVKELRAARPDVEIVISTTTSTGHAVARQKFPGETVCYFPLDFTWAVRRAIARIRPTAIVLVELELWPNFVFAAREAGVPVALINGRISEKSFRGYRRLRPLMRRLLAGFEFLAAQNETYAERLAALGAPRERVTVTGSIKFDHVETDRGNAKTAGLRDAFGIAPQERVFIAGSTQEPEEAYAIDTWLALRTEFPDLRLVLVPRHKERFDEVARLVEGRGLPLLRRSQWSEDTHTTRMIPATDHGHRTTDQPVCLLDTLGELAACWGLADIAFVGGSLTRRGGQNMIEPAAYGAAVLFGPNTWNFRDVVEVLTSAGAARVVTDPDDLTRTVRECLADAEGSRARGRSAQQLVLAQQGATSRTVELLVESLLSPVNCPERTRGELRAA